MGNPTLRSRDFLHKEKGYHADRVHSDQMVLGMIRRGKVVLVTEVKSLKANTRDYQPHLHSYQMVLVIARLETGPCELRPNSRKLKLELENNSRQSRNPIKNKQSDSLTKSQVLLSHGVLMTRELVSMKIMMLSENKSN